MPKRDVIQRYIPPLRLLTLRQIEGKQGLISGKVTTIASMKASVKKGTGFRPLCLA